MGIRKLKPVTPGSRLAHLNTYEEITTNKPEKSLLGKHSKSGGRNNQGRMTMRYLGGGHKKSYRIIDFKRDKKNVPGVVKTIEYDPNRTAFIALIAYKDGEKRYIIAPQNIKVGQEILAGDNIPPEIGNCMPIGQMPLGTIVHNVELRPGQGAQLARSAGSYAQLLSRDGKFAILRLPSGESRMILITCCATVGAASNSDHSNISLGKAGRNRWLGRRPRVRGVAMNPVDHPMGGGEGRASGGHPRSRNGLYAKGLKTRRKKNSSNKFIVEKRKKNK